MKTLEPKKTYRPSQQKTQSALLRDLCNLRKVLTNANFPKKKVSPWKLKKGRSIEDVDAGKRLADFHARIDDHIRNVRNGRYEHAAFHLGMAYGIVVGVKSVRQQQRT